MVCQVAQGGRAEAGDAGVPGDKVFPWAGAGAHRAGSGAGLCGHGCLAWLPASPLPGAKAATAGVGAGTSGVMGFKETNTGGEAVRQSDF